MEKKIELGKLVSASNYLNTLSTQSYKGKTAFKLSALKISLKEFNSIAETERATLIKDKFGVKDESGNYNVPTETVNDFLLEYGIVLNEKHTIEFEPLSVSDFDMDVPLLLTDSLFPFFE